MIEPNDKHELDAQIRARLLAEAEASRPAFSESLHQRTMAAVRARASVSPASREPERTLSPPARQSRPWRGWSLSIATALATCVMLWAGWRAWDSQRGPGQDRGPAPQVAEQPVAVQPERDGGLPISPPVSEELTALVDNTIAQSQWAYLDHDARLATDLVLSQLPFDLPSGDEPLDEPPM